MRRYPLGRICVSRISFGAMQLPGPGVFGPPRDRDEALAVLRRAVGMDVDHIDTTNLTSCGGVLRTICAASVSSSWRPSTYN